MMKITCKDLMDELEFSNFKEFNRVLKCFHFNTFTSLKDTLGKSQANKIAMTIRLKEVDWFKYKQLKKDTVLKEVNANTKQYIEKLLTKNYPKNKINKIDCKENNTNKIISIILNGEDLKGAEDKEFYLEIKNKLNLIIGDRGSGKSTVLEMLGLVSNSLSKESIERKIGKKLHSYEIDSYLIVFVKNTQIYSYFVETPSNTRCLYICNDGVWKPLDYSNEIVDIAPKILLLNQQELMRISENKNNEYLNSLLDMLNEELLKRRKKLSASLENFSIQYSNTKDFINKYNFNVINTFIKDEKERLYIAKNELNSNHSVQGLLDHIWQYLKKMKDSDGDAVINLLKSGEQRDMIHLYLGAIKDYLIRKLIKIQKLKNLSKENRKKQISDIENELKDTSVGDSPLVDDYKLEKELSQYDMELFKKFTDKDEESCIECSELKSILTIIINFLDNRLDILAELNRIYSNIVLLNPQSVSLIKKYKDLIDEREALSLSENIQCQKITDSLNDYEMSSKFSSSFMRGYDNKFEILKLEDNFKNISKYRIDNSFTTFKYIIKNYIQHTNEIYNSVENITANKEDFLLSKLNIKLLVDEEYVDFSKLSYGQKSGIFLSVILLHTDSDIVLLDQPEDNLDVHSTIKILIPIIDKIKEDKQLVIVSNNSNIIIGEDANIVVLESSNSKNHISCSGSIKDKEIALKVVDILEGGIEVFKRKVDVYKNL